MGVRDRIPSTLLLTLVLCVAGPASAGSADEHVVRLTRSGARNGQPFFSPDGAWISYVSDLSGSWQVWVMRSDGSDARQITWLEGPTGWPSWSQDGRRILFYGRLGERYALLETATNGGDARSLRKDAWSCFRPLLSPDGERLLFDRYDPSSARNHDIYVLDLLRGSVDRLTDDPGYDSDARWSPDGQSILFHSDREPAETFHTQIYRMAADGSEVRRLTSGPAKNAYPAWSPDGRWFVYTSEQDGNWDIWIADRDGGRSRRLTTHPGLDSDPVWSPDGSHVVFSTDRFGNSIELALIAVETVR